MYSVIAHKKGNGPKIMLCAHLDEIALMVTHIEDDGSLRLGNVGGVDPRILPASRVWVHGREKLFGVQIDTVCDMVSFGLTPVIIGYALGMRGVFDILVFLFFAVCGGVRLAYFNTQAIARPDLKMDHFTGVPIPFICYVLPFLVLLMCFVPFSVMRVVLPIAYLLIAVGYILKVRIAKMSLRTGLIMVAVEAACVLGLFLAGDILMG